MGKQMSKRNAEQKDMDYCLRDPYNDSVINNDNHNHLKGINIMKKIWPVILFMTLLLAACGSGTSEEVKPSQQAGSGEAAANDSTGNGGNEAQGGGSGQEGEKFVYQSESGPVQVPVNPQRVVVLTRFLTGNVMLLDVPLVGVDEMSKDNPNFAEQLKDVETVSDENLEKILALDPDLIIGLDGSNNLDKLKEIAPTVMYTYGKLDYLQQHIEIGKLLNKEEEARAWTEDFTARTKEAGQKIRAVTGENATVSVIETFGRQLYVYGYNFGRGTELLYGDLGLKLPEKAAEATKADGYMALSTEVLPEYMGDYIVFSKDEREDNSFQDTMVYKSVEAVKNNRVFIADAKTFYFNDPLSLEFQLQFFIDHFLGAGSP
jgi:iron complex transport system substrate-binding protein